MFEKYSYQTKFKALLIIFLMLSYTAYKRSFASLITVVKENTDLKEKVAKINSGPKNVTALINELAILNKAIGKEGVDKEKIQQDIVGFVANYGEGASIFDLQPMHEFNDENHVIYTSQLDVTGNINQLLKLSYEFEKKFTYSRIVSLNFYSTKKNNLPDVLHLKMIFQNYESKN